MIRERVSHFAVNYCRKSQSEASLVGNKRAVMNNLTDVSSHRIRTRILMNNNKTLAVVLFATSQPVTSTRCRFLSQDDENKTKT